MATIEVKLKNIDSKNAINPARCAEIKFRDGTIETPTRGSNQYEYNAKTRIPTDILIGSKVNLKLTSISYNMMVQLLKDNAPFTGMYNSQEKSNRLVQHTLLNLALFQPTTSLDPKRGIKPSMTIIQESEENQKIFLDLVIQLQQGLHFPLITVPYLDLPFKDLKSMYKYRCNEIRNGGAEPFIVLDLKHKHDDFEKILQYLVNDLQLRLIGLIFKRFKYAPLNYRTLRKYYDKDVLFYTLQVGRYDLEFNALSSCHYMPFLTNDIFTISAPRGYNKKESNDKNRISSNKAGSVNYENYLYNLSRLKLFDRHDLQLKMLPLHLENYERILNEVDKSGDPKLTEILQNYTNESNDSEDLQEKYSIINSFTRVHEFKASTLEFEKFRKFVKENETRSYLRDHSLLDAAVNRMN